MNKKNKVFIIAICAIFAIVFMAFIVWNHKISSWSEEEIKEFLVQNEEEFTKLAEQIYSIESSDGLEIYRNITQISKKGIISKLFLKFKVNWILCYNHHRDHEYDEVIISFAGTLDAENRRNHYYEWGIYYSPTNEMIGYAGHHINWEDGEQESYEYKPEMERAHYYTERICDNWFFYKQGVWN